MRFFLNVIYNFSKSENGMGATLPIVRKIMKENNWNQERILFHFKDINDAASEKNTVHSKMMRKFPEMAPYWNSDYAYYKATHGRPSASSGNLPEGRPVQPHQYSHFTNFPGLKAGKVQYLPEDAAVTGECMEEICARIPKPYSFYEAVVILDGVNWSGSHDMSPAIEWGVVKEEQEAGNRPCEPGLDEAFPEYQSNSIRLAKEFDMGAELDIQMELTDTWGMDKASEIIAIFAKQFGIPVKQYVRARGSWEERGDWQEKRKKLQQFFDVWTEKTRNALALLYREDKLLYRTEKEKGACPKKTAGRKTMQKHFLEKSALRRHELRRWDDYGWYKVLPHHYYCHLELEVNPKPQNRGNSSDNRYVNFPTECTKPCPPQSGPRTGSYNCMYLHFYGCNFDCLCNVLVEDFISDAGDPAGEITFWLFEEFLHRFEAEAVPEIVKIYGDTPETFVQSSYARDYIHNQRCVTGIIEVSG